MQWEYGRAAERAQQDQALLELLGDLRTEGYAFTTPTPASHARVLKRLDMRQARDLRGVFGWSLPFDPAVLPPGLLDRLQRAGAAERIGRFWRSRIRVSSLDERLFLHSAYPTQEEDAVFFGPDSYRFAALIRRTLGAAPDLPAGAVADIGAGAGVGGLTAADILPPRRIVMTDVNPEALRLAAINTTFAGHRIETLEAADLEGLEGPLALALANPPYIDDSGDRAYRDGGAMHGGQLSLAMARDAAAKLAQGGLLILYTGAAIVDGRDALRAALEQTLRNQGCTLTYEEIDPDVFGEELDRPAYRDVERIAVVAAVARKA